MANDAEASAFLRMLLDRMKAAPLNHRVHVAMELTETEMNRLMEWADADDEASSDDETDQRRAKASRRQD
jgi:hypothetical protein